MTGALTKFGTKNNTNMLQKGSKMEPQGAKSATKMLQNVALGWPVGTLGGALGASFWLQNVAFGPSWAPLLAPGLPKCPPGTPPGHPLATF